MGNELKEMLNVLRDNKDFNSLKEIRDYIRFLVAVNNKDWFED